MIVGLPYYLRTSVGTDAVGYNTLDQAKSALKTLLALEIERGGHVVEQEDHKWISHHKPHGIFMMWIETDTGSVIALG
jgi:hypothetical protein